MSDIQPTKRDKREAVEIARLLGAGAGIFDIGLGTRVGQTAERIAHIRADAVKVERDGWKIIELPGPCDASCKHRWTSFEDMLEPCRSCKHLTSTERWVTVNTHYEPREVNLSDDREARNG